MGKSSRMPLQVSPEFKGKLEELQRKIMQSKGVKVSFRDLTTDIVKSPLFNELEQTLIKTGDLKTDIKIKLDRRFL